MDVRQLSSLCAERVGGEGGGAPAAATIAPPIAGPAGRVMLVPMLFSAAAGSTSRGAIRRRRPLPGRIIECGVAADEEGEERKQPGRDEAEPGADGEQRGGDQHDLPAVETIG